MKYYFYFYLAGRQPARPTEVQKTFRILEKKFLRAARERTLSLINKFFFFNSDARGLEGRRRNNKNPRDPRRRLKVEGLRSEV